MVIGPIKIQLTLLVNAQFICYIKLKYFFPSNSLISKIISA